MAALKYVFLYLIAVFLLLGAYGHIANPEFYRPLTPPFIPLNVANILAAIVEAALGVGLLIPQTRNLAGLGFLILMVIFLPLHVWDLLKEAPAMGSVQGAVIRLLLQFLLIYAGWWIWKTNWQNN